MRNIEANANASADTQVYLYQTWARPNLVNAPFTTVTDPVTGEVSFTTTPATSFYDSLQDMAQDLGAAYDAAAVAAGSDGSGGVAGVAPVGDAFMLAIAMGVVTANHYAADAMADGLPDLWWDDGTHASRFGSYLSALTLFGTLTGLDPASLGAAEIAASDLGIGAREALLLQRVASLNLGFDPQQVSEPGVLALWGAAALAGLAFRRRRRPDDARAPADGCDTHASAGHAFVRAS